MVQKRIALVPCHKRQNGQCNVCKNVQNDIIQEEEKCVLFCCVQQMQTTRNGRIKALQWRVEREIDKGAWKKLLTKHSKNREIALNNCFPKVYLFSCRTNTFRFSIKQTVQNIFMHKHIPIGHWRYRCTNTFEHTYSFYHRVFSHIYLRTQKIQIFSEQMFNQTNIGTKAELRRKI